MQYLSMPFAVHLADESSWEAFDDRRTSFGVLRFHFRLDDMPLSETHKVGDAIGVYQKPKDSNLRIVKSDKAELEQVILNKTVENHLMNNECLAELAIDFVQKSKLSTLFGFETSLKSKVATKIATSYGIGIEVSQSEKMTRSETLEIENHLGPNIVDAIVSVPVYKRRAVDITLGHIDFLKVDYRRSILGLRKKAVRSPLVLHPKRHPNRIKFGLPVATAYYWQLLPSSSKFIYERDHKIEVADPLQVTICPPRVHTERFVSFPSVPTLYQVASAAFPKKWIWRKSVKQDWTEESLKQIELEEVQERLRL